MGTPKVKCLEGALRKFSKWIEIDPRIELWKKEDGGVLLEGVDWVVGVFPHYGYTFFAAHGWDPL